MLLNGKIEYGILLNIVSQYRIPILNYDNKKEWIKLKDKILRKLFLGFIQIHILHHAKEHPIYGVWMHEELEGHGYEISAGTLYPILHNMESDGLLLKEERKVGGKIRKYYTATNKGEEVLVQAQTKAYELFKEIKN